MKIQVTRYFMFSPLEWEKAKSKIEKAKSLDSVNSSLLGRN